MSALAISSGTCGKLAYINPFYFKINIIHVIDPSMVVNIVVGVYIFLITKYLRQNICFGVLADIKLDCCSSIATADHSSAIALLSLTFLGLQTNEYTN